MKKIIAGATVAAAAAAFSAGLAAPAAQAAPCAWHDVNDTSNGNKAPLCGFPDIPTTVSNSLTNLANNANIISGPNFNLGNLASSLTRGVGSSDAGIGSVLGGGSSGGSDSGGTGGGSTSGGTSGGGAGGAGS